MEKPAKGTLLIVDDEVLVLKYTSEIARREGYDVIEAESGPEALEKVRRSGVPIDLLVTDLIMPGMTGRVLADALKARYPGIGVIFISGHVRDSLSPDIGPDLHFIQKPFEPRRLSSLIKEALRK